MGNSGTTWLATETGEHKGQGTTEVAPIGTPLSTNCCKGGVTKRNRVSF